MHTCVFFATSYHSLAASCNTSLHAPARAKRKGPRCLYWVKATKHALIKNAPSYKIICVYIVIYLDMDMSHIFEPACMFYKKDRQQRAPMPPKRSPRDQKILPKASKTAPKINKKRYLQLPESLDPSQNHIISNCRKSPYENWWRVASGTVITIVFSKSEEPKSPQKQYL